MGILSVALIMALLAVTSFLYDGWIVIAGPAVIAALLAGFWFIRPLTRG